MKSLVVLVLAISVQAQAQTQTNKEVLQSKVLTAAGKYQLIARAGKGEEIECEDVIQFKPTIVDGELKATIDLDCDESIEETHFKGYHSMTSKTKYSVNHKGEIKIKNTCREVSSGGDGYTASLLSMFRATEKILISKDQRFLNVTFRGRMLSFGNQDCTHSSAIEFERAHDTCVYERVGN